ncbi:MAG TPA: hypothetical protein VHB98_00465 [Chloroflexota bacterium]|nr:hypothetical protein [Chloroflexota bacterium]
MTTITRVPLRHRRLIALAWILIATLGASGARTLLSGAGLTLARYGTSGDRAEERGSRALPDGRGRW